MNPMIRPGTRGGIGMGGSGPVAVPRSGPFNPTIANGAMPGALSQLNRPSTPGRNLLGAIGAGAAPTVLPAGMRPPSSSGNRPGTGMKRLGTASGPPGTAGSGGPGGPLPLPARVEVRPVTNHGLTGAPLKTASGMGPGRMVADRTYWLSELRNRVVEASSEIDSMRAEMTRYQADSALYGRLERRYEEAVKEVRGLEGQLADFNLALDKLRTNADVREIEDAQARLRERNDEERRRIDEMFVRRSEAEGLCQQLDKEIADLHRQAADRMRSLGDRALSEYAQLEAELGELNEQSVRSADHLAEVEGRVRSVRHQLQSPQFALHARASELQKKRAEVESRRAALEEECTQALSPEQIREKLLQKVKDLNNEIRDCEARSASLEGEVDRLQEEAKEKEGHLQDAKRHAGKAKQMEALYERDKKMQEFISTFPATKQADLDTRIRLQHTIAALMEHISKGIKQREVLPDAEKLTELKDELSFKTQKMKNSETTLEHVKKELEKRRAELAQIKGLDEKIGKDLSQLRERMEQMKTESKSFRPLEQLKAEAELKKKDLLQRRAQARQAREAVRAQIQELTQALDKRKKDLGDNPNHTKLEALQQKLRAQAQSTFQLQDYIVSRKREGDYDTLVHDVLELSRHINETTVASVRE